MSSDPTISVPFDAQITFWRVDDLAETTRFYEGVLGLELALDQGTCRIYRTTADAYLGFCLGDRGDATGLILTLVTEDVDGWYERLCAAGVTIEHAPRRNDHYGIYHFYARDPTGLRVEFQRFEDPRRRPAAGQH